MADFPDAQTHVSVEALADDGAVDVTVVATPPSRHADLAIALLDKGKHVVVEKPTCLSVADSDRMMAAAVANDRVLTVHQSRRWDTGLLAVRRAVDLGLVGDVFNIETLVGGFEHPCRAWHSEESISGGALYECALRRRSRTSRVAPTRRRVGRNGQPARTDRHRHTKPGDLEGADVR